eukprot:366018-Chlamydomonas_euryale.AAC.13
MVLYQSYMDRGLGWSHNALAASRQPQLLARSAQRATHVINSALARRAGAAAARGGGSSGRARGSLGRPPPRCACAVAVSDGQDAG